MTGRVRLVHPPPYPPGSFGNRVQGTEFRPLASSPTASRGPWAACSCPVAGNGGESPSSERSLEGRLEAEMARVPCPLGKRCALKRGGVQVPRLPLLEGESSRVDEPVSKTVRSLKRRVGFKSSSFRGREKRVWTRRRLLIGWSCKRDGVRFSPLP